MEINRITERILGAAIEVHRKLGPGLLESPYRECLALEMDEQGLRFRRKILLPVYYKGRTLETGYRLDFLVEGKVVVEAKAVAGLLPVHTAQVLTYLRLGGFQVGLLINFNATYLGEGAVRRLVHHYRGASPGGRAAASPRR